MKFICLICAETAMEQMPEVDAEKHFQKYAEFTADIKRNGHFIGANRLTPADTAITVRERNGKVSTTDGPFAETKEQFGGYYVIEAKDLKRGDPGGRQDPRGALRLRRGAADRGGCADARARI
jgi:hypothetical protein